MPLAGIAPYIFAAKPPPSFLIRTKLSFRISGRHAPWANSDFKKIKKVLAKDHPLMLQYYQRWDGPAFLSANFLLAQTA